MSTRVLMFGWEFPPYNSGGLGTACEGLVRELVAQGDEVTFVLPRRIPVSMPGVRFVFADIPEAKAGVGAYLSEGEHGKLYGGSLIGQVKLYAEAARTIAADGDYDVIHAHDWLCIGAGIVARDTIHKPLVMHVHATEFDRTGNGVVNQEVYDIEREGITRSDGVVAVSNFTKQILVERYGADTSKITVVHNGITEVAPSASPAETVEEENWTENLEGLKRKGDKIVLFLGRLTLQKGPDYFLKAAARVLEKYPKVLFIIAGSGDMENQIVRDAAAFGISHKVIFAGFVRGKELTTLYRAADLYVMPSVSEPFGITPLESLVQGTPVLISKQSGVSEVIKHALTADFWDTDDIADKIISVLKHPSLYHTLRANGQREARLSTWKKAAEKMSTLYKKILGYFKKESKE